MAKWWHISWKRVAILLFATFAGLWLLVGTIQLISLQLRPWDFARDLRRENPQVDYIPATLPDRSITSLSGMRIEAYGLSLSTPWQEVARQKAFRSVSVWNFKDGINLLIMNGSNIRGPASFDREEPEVVRLLGQATLRTESALMTAEMYTTTAEVKWWKLPRQNARVMTLAGMKEAHLHKYGRIYAVDLGRMHGFQEGVADAAPFKIELNLFDPDDHHYEIEISGQEGKPLPLTQTQLNSMIASIQPDSQK